MSNASNTSPTCPATTMAHTETYPIEQHSDQGKSSIELEPPSYASLDIPTLMKKDPGCIQWRIVWLSLGTAREKWK